MKALIRIIDGLFFAWTRGCGLVKCSIKGCNKQAKHFKKSVQFCEEHAREIGMVKVIVTKESFKENTTNG